MGNREVRLGSLNWYGRKRRMEMGNRTVPTDSGVGRLDFVIARAISYAMAAS